MKSLLHAFTAAALLSAPAWASGLGDWTINPYTATVSDLTFTLGGRAHGTVFSPDLPTQGFDETWGATGAATLTANLQRDYDSGMSLALKTAFEIAHDKLSGDNYGSRLVEKVYGVMQTGLGKVEIGMTDGAAYALSVTGPVVDDETTMDNANATFFRDPVTGRAVTEIFALNSSVESSLNYAKISYYTPRLFGLQVAASYTPSEGRQVIPFLSNGPHMANRQKSIWEAAVSYSGYYGPFAVGAYGGFAFGHGDGKAPEDASLTEWGFGSEVDYTVNDDLKLSVGGAYRHANTYAFDIYDAVTRGGTESAHLSASLTTGPWILGGEYGSGTTKGLTIDPVIGVRGLQASVGYVVNSNLQVTVGWQELHYSRDLGLFYNGRPRAVMDAAFVHLRLHV